MYNLVLTYYLTNRLYMIMIECIRHIKIHKANNDYLNLHSINLYKGKTEDHFYFLTNFLYICHNYQLICYKLNITMNILLRQYIHQHSHKRYIRVYIQGIKNLPHRKNILWDTSNFKKQFSEDC